MKTLDFKDLDFARAFTYIASQDPEVSMRFYLPVGNWLTADGLAVLPEKVHPNIEIVEDGKHRFIFNNPKDNRRQRLCIDGTENVIVNGLKPAQLSEVFEYVASQVRDPRDMDGTQLLAFMDFIQTRFGVADFYDGEIAKTLDRMNPCDARLVGETAYGGFVPKPKESAAIGYGGEIAFNLLKGDPQSYTQGGFVTFPSVSAAFLQQATPEQVLEHCRTKKITPRAVEARVFCRQNTYPDNSKIPLPS